MRVKSHLLLFVGGILIMVNDILRIMNFVAGTMDTKCCKLYYSVLLLIVILNIFRCEAHNYKSYKNLGNFENSIEPTKGQPWPKPQIMTVYGDDFLIVRPAVFQFKVTGQDCNILEEALKRYYNIIFYSLNQKGNVESMKSHKGSLKPWKNSTSFLGYLDELNVELLEACEDYPHSEMNELYELIISPPESNGKATLEAYSIWGILRGLETFSQLLVSRDDFAVMEISSLFIYDYPRFPYRSVLLDSSRHFISKKVIKQNLDLMAMNKYNVFHWHIVDDQSFPYQSKAFPALSEKGAYRQYTHVYTQRDVEEIIEYARYRGIRVIPEFDTPGHTYSWGKGAIEGFLTECQNSDGSSNKTYGPIDPTRVENYAFLKTLFEEIFTVFKDRYVHLGGDEVDFSCWKSNQNVTDFMASLNLTSYEKLEEYYMQKLIDIVENIPGNNSYIVWQEVLDNNVELNPNTIVHVWKGDKYNEELANVTALGYRALLSACWYLDYISYSADWKKYYLCDPENFLGTEEQKKLVMGGGPALWGELVDSTNLIPRLWPRASAPAERLWANINITTTFLSDASHRIEEHRCRLLKRGYNVQPVSGPGFCPVRWD